MLGKRIILIAFLVFFLSSLNIWAVEGEKRLHLPLGSSPQIGSEKAALTIFEFVDFQ